MNRRHLLPAGSALLAAGLFVAACGSSATPAPSVGLPGTSLALPSFAVPSIALPSIAVPSIAVPSLPASIAIPSLPASLAIPSIAIGSDGSFDLGSFEIPSFSFPSEDKDLEARLPNQINGVTLTKYSMKGSSFLASGSASTQDLTNLLNTLGKTPDDLSIAFAGDPTGNLDVQIGAFRIAGADANALQQAFIVATKNQSPEDVITQGNVGGKNVTQIVDPTDPTTTQYIYTNGDTLFFVGTSDPALAGAALTALP